MWKHLLLIFLWGSIASSALAQKANEILIVSEAAEGGRILPAIKPHYSGVITTATSIPLDLSGYDAVMIDKPNIDLRDIWLDSFQQDRLIKYLIGGGRFYAEGTNFRNWTDGNDDTTDNQFWDFIGDTLEGMTSAFIFVNRVTGVEGEFTAGLSFDHPYNHNGDASSGFHISGMVPVITDNGYPNIAYRAPDLSTKAILHWPVVADHYNDFLARVVCTYFQLCALDVAEQDAKPALRFDPIKKLIHLPGEGQIVLTDILGRTALTQHAGSERFAIPEQITGGTFIATWTSGEQRAAITISIQ